MYIDERLSWDNHIQQVASKLSKNIGILAKLKYTVPQKVLFLIYSSLVLPYLTYCNLVWAFNSASKLKSVAVLQKRAVRNIAKVDYCAHTSPLFKKLDLLKVTDICCFQTALFTFKFSQSQLPSKFNDYFSRVTSVHYYTTRSSTSAFMLPFCRTTVRQKCIRCQGPSVWNSLP